MKVVETHIAQVNRGIPNADWEDPAVTEPADNLYRLTIDGPSPEAYDFEYLRTQLKGTKAA
ncbi:MAG: hypothetical protein AAF557_22105 [Pseudomonadota bacterium]